MINARAMRGQRDALRRCIYLSTYASERQRVMRYQRGVDRKRACTISGWTGPGGCCARVRINLRLLVKIRALSFHLCARERGLVRSFGPVQRECQGRVFAVLVGHLHEIPSR